MLKFGIQFAILQLPCQCDWRTNHTTALGEFIICKSTECIDERTAKSLLTAIVPASALCGGEGLSAKNSLSGDIEYGQERIQHA